MEEANFPNQRMVRRRLVEAQGGAEVRRIHILYFLSRNGCSEHPHLIRVHHFSKNGVRLRDVRVDIKRWLGELRGKDMPESFAWSYKRIYKAGYVWQDIADDDLITPLSDNEYVLKGSDLSSSIDFSITPMQKDSSSIEESTKDSSNYVSSNTSSSSSVQESSPSFGSETSTSARDGPEKNSSTSMALLKKSKVESINGKSSSKKGSPSDKRKSSQSSGILQNLFTCGGVDTNDSVVMYKPLLKTCSCDSEDVKDKGQHKPPRTPAYRPLYGPNCSQCRKTFRPEKLHSHMKSCKGIKKALPNPQNISNISTNDDSLSAHLITLNC